MRKIHISQPRMYPHISYLDKINKADIFVVSDDLIVKKNLFEVRNKYHCILSHTSKYLNVQIQDKRMFRYLKVMHPLFYRKHKLILKHSYNKYPYYDYDILEKSFPDGFTSPNFMEYFLHEIRALMKLLDIDTTIRMSSHANSQNRKTERLNDIIKYYDGEHYISGMFGRKYIENLCVPVEYHDTNEPKFYYGRKDMLMIYDTIFSIGVEETKKIIHDN